MTPSSPPAIAEYRLRLDVDFAGLRWRGTVEFDAPQETGRYALDCEDLDVPHVRVAGQETAFRLDRERHQLEFDVPAGTRGSVAVDFSGAIETKNLFGFYRSRHGESYLLTTHCEPTGARRVFPCVDRPDRKARIRLTVDAPAELDVVANAPVRTSEKTSGRTSWEFEPTPEMSTYLFYLGVGRLNFVTDRSSAVAVRVAVPPGRTASAGWALRSAGQILRAYESYYGIPYPLPKLDLIAVPEHAFGAMENWGAISFQETRLLVDGASSTFATRDVFETTAHEIAHQWFGNLVTMAWWDDIWLNESFAALMETKITERLEPSFDPWSEFFVRTMGKAAAVDGDSLRSTHPVRAHVERPEEMSQIFDEISYGKGSSVLAMLDRYLGEERFRAGVTDYLSRFRFRNARTEDLFDALARGSGEPVGAIAGPWIDRPGLPVIHASRTPRGLHLRQRRFSYDGERDEAPWPIPLVYDVDGRRERLLFDTPETDVAVPEHATVVLNPGSIGFYRVDYEPALLRRLLEVVPPRGGKDGWAIVDDLAAFVLSGAVPFATFAAAAERFGSSSERLVVEALASTLVSLALTYPEKPAVVGAAREFLRQQTERVGVDRRPDEPAGTGVLRDRLTFGRVRLDPDFAASLAGRFDRWSELDPDLRTSVAIARVRAGGDAGYAAVRAALSAATTAVEELRLERGLAWSPRSERVRELLDLASGGKINRSHVLVVALQGAANPAGRDVTWAWLQKNLDVLTGIFRGSGYLPLLLETTLPILGRGRAAEVRAFFQAHPTPEATRGLAKGLERLELSERLGTRLA